MKTLLYKLFKIPVILEELLDKAKREGESKIHIVTNYTPITDYIAYPGGKFSRLDVSINVRYFHGKKMREIRAYSVSSNFGNYNADLRIKSICDDIKSAGFNIQTIRKRRFGEKLG
mgnify:CR=1 FL=1